MEAVLSFTWIVRSAPLRSMAFVKVTTFVEVVELRTSGPTIWLPTVVPQVKGELPGMLTVIARTGGKPAAAGRPRKIPGARDRETARESDRAAALQNAAVQAQETGGRQAGSAVGLNGAAGDDGVARVVVGCGKDRRPQPSLVDGAAAADHAAIGGSDSTGWGEIERARLEADRAAEVRGPGQNHRPGAVENHRTAPQQPAAES